MTRFLEPQVAESRQSKLGNLKVLLAEDNEVNQLLVRSILLYWGLESKTATTGVEVLELMDKEDFDMILMDIQMPDKNGIEATVEIRDLLDNKKKNIPIIALTANALIGEEKKYKAAGMDDFLTKPFKEEELYNVMYRVLNNNGGFGRSLNAAPVINVNETMVASSKIYDLKNILDIARGNQDFVLTLVKIFLETIPADSKNMVKACEEKKWDQVSKLAHKLKTTIDTLHVHSITEVIRVIEMDAKQQVNVAALPALVFKVDRAIDNISCSLREDFEL